MCLLCTLKMQRISRNYDEMREKQGANMLNHVVFLVGQDQLYFFPLLLNNDYCVFRYFLGIAAMLRDQFLAIAEVECSIFSFKIN